jgi:hypothetical protein
MTQTIRRKGWRVDNDGVPCIWKDPDINVYYTLNIKIKDTTLSVNPTWVSDGSVAITNDSHSLSGSTLTLTLQVSNVGEGKVSFTDTSGNEEKLTFRWKERDR